MLEKEILNDKIEIVQTANGYPVIQDVKGCEGLYAVSNDGQVWSHISNKWLKPSTTSNGYASVRLKGKTQNVHRLIAEAFCNKSKGCDQVNHINGDKLDNRAENLEWVTMSQNHKHAFATGLRKPSDIQREAVRQTALKKRRFTINEIRYIRKMFNDFDFTQTAIAKFFKTSQSVIHRIVSGESYSEVA